MTGESKTEVLKGRLLDNLEALDSVYLECSSQTNTSETTLYYMFRWRPSSTSSAKRPFKEIDETQTTET
jgi:hypothetical protein